MRAWPGCVLSTTRPSFDDCHAADQHELEARAGTRRLLVSRLVGHGLRIEHDDVRVRPFADASLAAGLRRRGLQPLRRHQRHLADGIHQRQALLLPHVTLQDARVGARGARVALAATHEAVARDHHQRLPDDRVHAIVRVAANQHADRRARGTEAIVALLGQRFSRSHQPQVGVVEAHALAPAGVEERGVDHRHAPTVGVRLGGHVETAGARSLDHPQAVEHLPQAHAVDVDDVEWRPCHGRGRDHLAHRLDARARLA